MQAVVLNQGDGAWAFAPHAEHLARVLWVEVSDEPADLNYVLSWDRAALPDRKTFIPFAGMSAAGDKRLQAAQFSASGVPTPRTMLVDNLPGPSDFATASADRWVVKYPTSSGASGHRFLDDPTPMAINWPRPFVVQQFVELDPPEVYRLYSVAGAIFGWNVRRFTPDQEPSPWVAHATGAGYTQLGQPPVEAVDAARGALTSCDLLISFGCVDLLSGPDGWLVLEVGTDGMAGHVDRAVGDRLATEIDRRLAEAFWALIGPSPWGETWHRRP